LFAGFAGGAAEIIVKNKPEPNAVRLARKRHGACFQLLDGNRGWKTSAENKWCGRFSSKIHKGWFGCNGLDRAMLLN